MTLFSRDELVAGAEVVHRHMAPTPQIAWPLLARRCGGEVWVKHENHTPIGAFKVRGGLTYMDALRRDQPDVTGVVTATRGNHGQSVAFAAARSGLRTTVVVPHGNNPEKNAAMAAFGADVVEHGHDFQAAREFCGELSRETGDHMIGPWHPWLVLGVASYSLELLSAVPDLDRLYVPIGQGSGITGAIAAREALGLTTEIVGVVAENAPSYALSFAKGTAVETNSADTLADGLACRIPDPDALQIILRHATDVVSVSEDAIMAAMAIYFRDTHNAAEGAGAAPLAALLKDRDRLKGRKIGLVLSGGNADTPLFRQVLERNGED